jgi:hypothetical protein
VLSIISHLIEDFDDIYSHGAFGDTATTSCALIVIISLHKILIFVHDPLPEPGGLVRSGIMAGGMHGKIWKLAIIPGANSVPFEWGYRCDLI